MSCGGRIYSSATALIIFVPNHVNDGYYPKYKRAGIKFISIDPIYTETAQAFSAEWIPICPNTDVALMLGMCIIFIRAINTIKRLSLNTLMVLINSYPIC